jgi:hypothetical protein
MRDVREQILNEMDKRDFKKYQLASAIGADHSLITKYFRYQTNLPFRSLLIAARLFYGDAYKETLYNWRDEIESIVSYKQALEYASLNGDNRFLRYLLDNVPNWNRNAEKIAEVYELIYAMKTGKLTGPELSEAARSFKNTPYEEVNVLLRVIESYGMFMEGRYTAMYETSRDLEKRIQTLSDGFLRECFMVRLSEMYTIGYLQRNDVKKARYYANVVTQCSFADNLRSNAFYTLGMSYLYENKTDCITNLEKAYEILKSINAAEHLLSYALENIEFAKVHFGEETNPVSVGNKAYVAALKGDVELTKSIIENESHTPFCTYFIGLASDDPDVLWNALGEFIETGDLYFAQLPKRRLAALGERKSALGAIVKLRCS